MSIELSADKNAFLEKLIAAGRFSDRQHALDHAVDLLREESETLDDMSEGFASIRRGEGTPFDDPVEHLRSKYGIRSDT